MYDIGKEFKKAGKDDWDYSKEYASYPEDEQWFMMGWKGVDRPIKVEGWRYGEFTDDGRSKNHASGKLEAGISMMAVYSNGVLLEEASKASALFLQDKQIVKVYGYYTPDVYGSDGEPLILMAQHDSAKVK
jgi:hypothetical protein